LLLLVLAVHGDVHLAGKTTSLCRSCIDWTHANPKCNTIVRLLGTSTSTSTVRSLLVSLLVQLQVLYDGLKNTDKGEQEAQSMSFSLLTQTFRHYLLKSPSAKVPLVLFLDSIDQLNDTFDGRSLGWLPMTWENPALHIVISTIHNVGPTFKVLADRFPNTDERKGHWCEIPPLSPIHCEEIFTKMAAASHHGGGVRFTSAQRDVILRQAKDVMSPL
jgi:hypothetical protein